MIFAQSGEVQQGSPYVAKKNHKKKPDKIETRFKSQKSNIFNPPTGYGKKRLEKVAFLVYSSEYLVVRPIAAKGFDNRGFLGFEDLMKVNVKS